MAFAFLAAKPVRADIIQTVTATQGLVAAAQKIKDAIDSGTHVVRFSTYAKVGQFRLESPSTKVETLVFERDPLQQSDSALRISGDTALIEIKHMRRGTVILRGLAFHLASPEARLLAGSEPGKENMNLIIDSCFIFGDNNASSFLTWLGAAGSRIEIRRSFFVFRTGNVLQSRAILTGANFVLANNLFHFGGQVSGTVLSGGIFDFRSNTVQRTQLKLASEFPQGAHYTVTRNFIGHRPGQDAFSGAAPYFFWATDFHPTDSFVRNNAILRSWGGFDHPSTTTKWFASDTTNKTHDTITFKPVTELWDWYGPTGMVDSAGHALGRDRRAEPYNIFPGDDSSDFMFEGNPGTVYFKPALFPRQFSPLRTPMTVPTGLDSIRIHSPIQGALRLGPFQVDSMVINMATAYGRAQLLSADSAYQFRPQSIVSVYGARPHVFPNGFPEARYFFIAFKGNTPKGAQVVPDRTSSLSGQDSLAYGAVDSAGYTELFVETLQGPYPDSLRGLDRIFSVRSSATVSGSMVFGSTDNVKPYWSNQVYWWRPKDTLLHLAPRLADGRYVTSAPAVRNFSAYLVERLNVKRGKTSVFPLPGGGVVRATGVDGFQLRVDSLYLPDSLRFGRSSHRFSLAFTGRQAGDSVILRLPGGADTEVFRVADLLVLTEPSTVDENGFHSIPIVPADSNVRFFSGIRYNVIANQPFPETGLSGVNISGLISATSGKISVLPFNESLLSRGIGTKDTLPSNSRLLGGLGIRTLSLTLGAPWSASFPVAKAADPTQVAAYAWDGLKWRPLPPPVFATGDSLLPMVSGLWATDQAVAVLEVLRPASEYVTTETQVGNRTITVKTGFTNPVHRPITGFSLQVLHVNQFGNVETLTKGPYPVEQTAVQDLAGHSGLFAYAIVYHTPQGDYNRPSFTPVTSFGWNPDLMSVGGVPAKAVKQWHLIGSPCSTTFGLSLAKQPLTDTSVKDIRGVLKLKSVAGAAAWDSVLNEEALALVPGDAFLFSSASVHNLQVDRGAGFIYKGEHVLGPYTGWRFISPPYPINFHVSAVRSSSPSIGVLLELVVDSTAAGREYSWRPVTGVLKAFTGYAYKFAEGESLTFNPWSALAPSPVLAKVAFPAGPESSVGVTLKAEGRTRTMRFVAGPEVREMPFLPAPGTGLELRVGGKGGWFRKKVEDIQGIDEPLEIRSPSRLQGRLELDLQGKAAVGKDWQARLIDLASGHVLDPAEAPFSLAEGSNRFRLVAGTGEFVTDRVATFRRGLPSGLALSQNYPNPFRGLTRIAIDWPAIAGDAAGWERKAVLEVFDTRGRRLLTRDLGAIRAGLQVVSVDGAGWKPGLYTYRLTVSTAGSKIRLQKKMLVSP